VASQSGLMDVFLKKHPYIRYGLGRWREYTTGAWPAVDDLYVKNCIQNVIRGASVKLSSSLVNSLADLLKQRTYIPTQLFDFNPNILTFSNCCLDLITFRPVTHSPEYYSTIKLDFDYDPTATSAAWNRAVKSFPFPDVLQEFAGLALTTETKYEVALWLYGPAGGGKSTFIVGLEAAVGPRACVLGLDEIDKSDFALAQIPGKTLAVSTEQPSQFVKCSSKLNKLISGESTNINQKFVPQFSILPKVKILWAMNELPTVPSGAGAGLFRRVFPVYWPAIPEGSREPDLKDEIARSGMAVTNWALEGLKRLKARNRFDFPEAMLVARNAYKEQSDNTLSFMDDCCDLEANAEVSSSTLYEEYTKWCVKNGHRPLASNRFAADLERLGHQKTRRSVGVFWLNLTLKLAFPDQLEVDESL
jgi:putative DNA primase/helicase